MKIAVIGAGNVGASVGYALCLKGVCDELVMVDIFGDVARAKAMDMAQANCVFGADISVNGGDDYALLSGSDIVIITAGSPRKEGQSREDLLIKNAEVVKTASKNIAKFASNAVIIVITNPLDVMCLVAHYESGFDKRKIIGMAGELDSARLAYEIASLKGLKNSQIKAKVIGTHNDEMVIGRANLNVDLDVCEFETISNETKHGGAKIVKLLGTSAFYAPAAGAVKMCEAIKNQSDEILSCSVILGDDVASGRLVSLDKNGIKEILEPNLSKDEMESLKASEEKIATSFKFLKENL